MAEIVNLRQVRKAKKRADKETKAGENRTRFGQTKAETRVRERTRRIEKSEMDGKKLD